MSSRKKIGLDWTPVVASVGRFAVIVGVILVSCWLSVEVGRASTKIPAPSEGAALELFRQGFSEPVLESLRSSLQAYEEVRGELVGDRLEGVPAGASRLAQALRLALDAGTGLKGEFQAIIAKALLIAKSMAKIEDLDAARSEFGELSRLILILAGNDPRMAEGWHVFACPMTKTFGKWIQPTEALENPYMGQAMTACGFPTDWAVPAPSSAEEDVEDQSAAGDTPEVKRDSLAEPEFRPGIPGVKMEDVRDHKFLWREIEELQKWERGDQISIAEYRSKVIEKTGQFLELSGVAADEFAATAAKAVANLRESFLRMRQAGENPGGLETQFSSDLRAEMSRVSLFLRDEPRHQLFAPECKKWLLKLAFGPREAKEAREAEQARATLYPGINP